MSGKVIIDRKTLVALRGQEGFLMRADLRVLTSDSNREALETHRAERADLIIAKLDSSDMTGEELCDALRQQEDLRAVSIIIIYDRGRNDFDRCLRCRANAFLPAPINPSALLSRAERLMQVARRLSYRAPISIKVQGQSINKPFLAYSENVSATGMLFETERFLSKGERLTCSFFMPNGIQIITNAEVIRVVKTKMEYGINQYGIRFSDLPEEVISAIDAYVAEKQRQEDADNALGEGTVRH